MNANAETRRVRGPRKEVDFTLPFIGGKKDIVSYFSFHSGHRLICSWLSASDSHIFADNSTAQVRLIFQVSSAIHQR